MILFIGRCGHLCLPAPVDDGDVFRTQQLGLHGRINRRHAAADNHDIAAYGQVCLAIRLTEIRNERNRIQHIGLVFTVTAQGVHATKANRQKHRIMTGFKAIQGQGTAKRRTGFDRDSTDFQQPIYLALSEIIGGFVRGYAEFIQSAGFGAGIVDDDVMTLHRQPVRTRQACGPRTDHCDPFAGGCSTGERMQVFRHQTVGGKALQAADLNGFAFGRFAHAGLFAQLFGGADAGAHAAKNVLRKDGFRRSIRGARDDLADEQRDVDGCGTGRDARRIMAEIAAVRRHLRLVPVVGGNDIGKIRVIGGGGQAP